MNFAGLRRNVVTDCMSFLMSDMMAPRDSTLKGATVPVKSNSDRRNP